MPDRPDILSSRTNGDVSKQLIRGLKQLAETSSLKEKLAFFAQEREWINQQHLNICRIAAPTFREQARAEFLRSLFRNLGHRATIDEAGNVVMPIKFRDDLPFVAVSAHMDTVLAPRGPEGISVRPDGTFDGPGVTDNGPGLAALVTLGRVLQDGSLIAEPRCNILLVANVAEEGEGNLQGIKYFCRHSRYASLVDSYLVLDGAATGHITAEALGSRRFEITIEGAGGHSWNDYGRGNPVHALGRTVAFLADLALPTSPRTTLNVGVIEGGSGVNSIAPVARAKVDIRSRSNDAMNTVVKAMEDGVRYGVEAENRVATERLANYKIREIGHRPAAGFQEHNPVLRCVRGVDTYLGINSRLDCASTDANVPLALGRPAVAMGAGGRGGGAHSPGEWYHPEGRELGLRRILLALALLLSNPN